jgi:catechol 2,3-dioxygenase-like lactoylglutathione lyase family enzyme
MAGRVRVSESSLHYGFLLRFARTAPREIAMKFNFDAIFYYVSDLERAIKFYTEVLGFELQSRDYVARFLIGGVLFELVPTTDSCKLQGGGNARLCLQVDDIHSAILDLRSKGVRTANVESKENGLLTCFPDPDGNEICLWQYTA